MAKILEVPAFTDEPDEENLDPNLHEGWMFSESDASGDEEEVEPSDPALAAGNTRTNNSSCGMSMGSCTTLA